jgi:hypothetical protein
MALLYGRAGRLTAENGGFRPRRAVYIADLSAAVDVAGLATLAEEGFAKITGGQSEKDTNLGQL